MRLVLTTDTHVPRRARDLPGPVWAAVDEADVVIHAGDWVDEATLDALHARSARLIGCYGNNDGPALRARLPEIAYVERWTACGSRSSTTPGPSTGAYAAVRRPLPTWTCWSSGTRTSRGTPRPPPGCGC